MHGNAQLFYTQWRTWCRVIIKRQLVRLVQAEMELASQLLGWAKQQVCDKLAAEGDPALEEPVGDHLRWREAGRSAEA